VPFSAGVRERLFVRQAHSASVPANRLCFVRCLGGMQSARTLRATRAWLDCCARQRERRRAELAEGAALTRTYARAAEARRSGVDPCVGQFAGPHGQLRGPRQSSSAKQVAATPVELCDDHPRQPRSLPTYIEKFAGRVSLCYE
jgi:hypothetical protein